MKRSHILQGVIAGSIAVALAATLAWSQGSPGQQRTPLGATDQIPLGYPCTVSCYGTMADVKTFANSGGTAGAGTFSSVTGSADPFPITGFAAAQGGATTVKGGASSTSGNAGGAANLTGGVPGATGVGGAAAVTGGIGGATSGAGGQAKVTGGAGTAGNGNGGSVVVTGGAANGSGAAGVIIHRSVDLKAQGAPAAKTTSATLTAAEVLTGIITVNQGGAGASAQQLPAASAMDTALPDAAAGDAFDFSVINISTTAAEAASLTTNTGWTLVGDMDIQANSAATTKSAGRFRVRKTDTATWVIYRLS